MSETYEDESTDVEFEQEDQNTDVFENKPQYLTRDDLDSFKQEMLQALKSQGSTAKEAKQETASFTEAQLAEFAQNPALLATYVAEKNKETETRLSNKLETEKWDRKAEKEFPHLKEKDFEKLVVEEIRDLVNYGDMKKDSPRLLYMAARNANSRYAKKSQTQVKPNDSAIPAKGAKASKTPTREDKDFQQKTQLLRMRGYSEDRIKKIVERYENTTEVRKSEESGRIRRRTFLK